MISTPDYSKKVEAAAKTLADADFILIGAGAGLSAAAGLNYLDPALFARWYPQFHKLGIRTIWEGITTHWDPTNENRRRFWAYWAHHIQTIRYDAPAGRVYQDLHRLVAGKEHFVITTNVDGQFLKGGFDAARMFTPQGDYGRFQCSVPCHDRLYDNHNWVRQMLAYADPEEVLVRETDIPRCPCCGQFMERNLRKDERFVESPWMANQPAYTDFVHRSHSGRLVLFELGAGFNTPAIIRWPFERVVSAHPYATLLRVNLKDASVSQCAERNAIEFQTDAATLISDLL